MQLLYGCLVIAGATIFTAIPVQANQNAQKKSTPAIQATIQTDSVKEMSLLTRPFRNQFNDPNIDNLIAYARRYTGTPYLWGSRGPNRFDCSGFTQYVYKHLSCSLNASAATQYQQGISVRRDDIRRGDLVFFKGRNASQKRVGHVGMVTEVFDDGTFQFIHASIRGVREDRITSSYYSQRFIGARRIVAPTFPTNWAIENLVGEELEIEDNTPFIIEE